MMVSLVGAVMVLVGGIMICWKSPLPDVGLETLVTGLDAVLVSSIGAVGCY